MLIRNNKSDVRLSLLSLQHAQWHACNERPIRHASANINWSIRPIRNSNQIQTIIPFHYTQLCKCIIKLDPITYWFTVLMLRGEIKSLNFAAAGVFFILMQVTHSGRKSWDSFVDAIRPTGLPPPRLCCCSQNAHLSDRCAMMMMWNPDRMGKLRFFHLGVKLRFQSCSPNLEPIK